MLQSHVIDIDGAFVGAAVRLDVGYRFIATDMRLDELDGSVGLPPPAAGPRAPRLSLGAPPPPPAGPATHYPRSVFSPLFPRPLFWGPPATALPFAAAPRVFGASRI